MVKDYVIIGNAGFVPSDLSEHLKTLGRVYTAKSPIGNQYLIINTEKESKEDQKMFRQIFPFLRDVGKLTMDAITAGAQIRSGALFEDETGRFGEEMPYSNLLGVALNDRFFEALRKKEITTVADFVTRLLVKHSFANTHVSLLEKWYKEVKKYPDVKSYALVNFQIIHTVDNVWNKRTLRGNVIDNKSLTEPPFEIGLVLNQYGFIVDVELTENSYEEVKEEVQ